MNTFTVSVKAVIRSFGVMLLSSMLPFFTSCGGDSPLDDKEMSETGGSTPEVTDSVSKANLVTIRAIMNQDSRVSASLDENNRKTDFRWEVGDSIKVYVRDDKPSIFEVTAVKGNEATLTGELEVENGQNVCGIYVGKNPTATSGSMSVQRGTTDSVGDHLIMISQALYNSEENQELTLVFSHLCALMTFNLTFPEEVTNVTDIRIENMLTDYTLNYQTIFNYQTISETSSKPITITGSFTPQNHMVPIHVVVLPGSKFNEIALTCNTNDGSYSMPQLTSDAVTVAGKNHRTSRTMEPFEDYEIVVLGKDGTKTSVADARHRGNILTWKSNNVITEGSYISICSPGKWKCFHTVTAEDTIAHSLTLPDINGGCTIDPKDPNRNDWITAVCMGGTVSTKYDVNGADMPLYWATGNLIAISQGDGTAVFRLATIDEMKDTEKFLHSPDNNDINEKGVMWDTFLYGDPTGMKKSTEFTIPADSICGTQQDIAHAKLGYDWRLPYLPSGFKDQESILNEFYSLYYRDITKFAKPNCIIYGDYNLYLKVGGIRSGNTWNYQYEGYLMSGCINSKKKYQYCYFNSTDGGFSFTTDPNNTKNGSAMNVRPVTP